MQFIQNQRLDNAIYWGTFLFAVFVSGYTLTTLIRLSSEEDTAYASSSYMRRQSQTANIETSLGTITIKFMRAQAPITVGNFAQLANSGFYDNTKIHNVRIGKLVEGGDPLSREEDRELYGTGGPGYVFEDEIRGAKMERGVVVMSNAGRKRTNGSRFFIVVAETLPEMQDKYTIFARVTKGMDVVDHMSTVPVDERFIPVKPIVVNTIVVE